MLYGLIASFLAACSPTPAVGAVDHAAIDVEKLHAELEAGSVPVLVDVRSAAEFAAGHVPGAINVPLDRVSDAPELLAYKDQEITLICQSGGRSARAQGVLSGRGFKTVNVLGGTGAWRAAGYPVQ